MAFIRDGWSGLARIVIIRILRLKKKLSKSRSCEETGVKFNLRASSGRDSTGVQSLMRELGKSQGKKGMMMKKKGKK